MYILWVETCTMIQNASFYMYFLNPQNTWFRPKCHLKPSCIHMTKYFFYVQNTFLKTYERNEKLQICAIMQAMLIYMTSFRFRSSFVYNIFIFSSACNVTLGIEGGEIKDNQLSSSDSKSNHPPDEARLNGPKAWVAHKDSPDTFYNGYYTEYTAPWIEVDFKKEKHVAGIATQGRADGRQNQWVTEYIVKYPKGILWLRIKESQLNYVSIHTKFSI